LQVYERASRLAPDDTKALINVGSIHRRNGRLTEAEAIYLRAAAINQDAGNVHLGLAAIYRALGRHDEYATHIARAEALIGAEDQYGRACVAAIRGDADRAIELLRSVLERGESSCDWARLDPDFAFIRDDPRFRELVGEWRRTRSVQRR
jgi:tetratricopeptide (TPR) repeat protein